MGNIKKGKSGGKGKGGGKPKENRKEVKKVFSPKIFTRHSLMQDENLIIGARELSEYNTAAVCLYGLPAQWKDFESTPSCSLPHKIHGENSALQILLGMLSITRILLLQDDSQKDMLIPMQERVAAVKPYWETLSQAARSKILTVSVTDLKLKAAELAERQRKQAGMLPRKPLLPFLRRSGLFQYLISDSNQASH